MRVILVLVCFAALTVAGCGSDSDSGNNAGDGGSAGSDGGTGGNPGDRSGCESYCDKVSDCAGGAIPGCAAGCQAAVSAGGLISSECSDALEAIFSCAGGLGCDEIDNIDTECQSQLQACSAACGQSCDI
jgi:hypothetical protein